MERLAQDFPARPNPTSRHRAAAGNDPSAKITLTVTDVQRFLGKSKRAFYLLRRDPGHDFPTPFVIQGRDHWLMRDLLEWIERRRRRDAVPSRTGRIVGSRGREVSTIDTCPRCVDNIP
jgi:hypothetical protein